jgi:hypothetical protein
MNLGDCVPGKVYLAKGVEDWGNLSALVNSMWTLHDLSEGGDPGCHPDD